MDMPELGILFMEASILQLLLLPALRPKTEISF